MNKIEYVVRLQKNLPSELVVSSCELVAATLS